MKHGIGIVGLGFMGKMHFDTYRRTGIARVVAVCDVDEKKRSGDWSSIAGNIGPSGGRQNLDGVAVYSELEKMLSNPEVTIVDITLPTSLHEKAVLAAIAAGKDVICEKPMARNSAEARGMLAAAKQANRLLYIAHCIRFWPTYAKAYELVRQNLHGRLISACFYRESSTPLGSYQNWLQNPELSGACALDLHIHDTDFILHCFGKPVAVTSKGAGFAPGRLDHILTTYEYADSPLIMAEGAWEHAKDYPFSMHFAINFEKGTLRGDHSSLIFYSRTGDKEPIPVASGDGYEAELRHFIGCIAERKQSPIATAETALQSLEVIEAEIASAATGSPMRIN